MLEERTYAYLLGLYLGDGWLSAAPRGVFILRVSLDLKYPALNNECAGAIARIRSGRVPGRFARDGCVNIVSYWKHWPCLFPQHGPGPKLGRKICLSDWQQEIVKRYPELLLRGLIQSDGCRLSNNVQNRLKKRVYSYPRYMFTNYSMDIQSIFCSACDDYGVRWRQMNWKTISIARRADVAKLDAVVGPKR